MKIGPCGVLLDDNAEFLLNSMFVVVVVVVVVVVIIIIFLKNC